MKTAKQKRAQQTKDKGSRLKFDNSREWRRRKKLEARNG